MDFDSDGVRLHYELHGPDSGTPVVLVHGYASDYRLNWVGTRWQETLTGAGYRVVGLDCRGHGHSEKPHDPAAYAGEVMAADVVRLMDHLHIESAHYLGYSMGARIGLQVMLARARPSRRARGHRMGWRIPCGCRHACAMRGEPTTSPIAQTFYDLSRPRSPPEAPAAHPRSAAQGRSEPPAKTRLRCWWSSGERRHRGRRDRLNAPPPPSS
jgi:pimeloyl-ACP methyl ester carboxylesterase